MESQAKSKFGFWDPLCLTDAEFEALRQLIYRRLGICLTPQKKMLLAGRLRKIIHAHGFDSYRRYYDFLIASRGNEALLELADTISTNHTFFYREKEHFDYFVQKALPALLERHRRERDYDLRIWCAGCSTGEEPYMLAMLMQEHFSRDLNGWSAGVLATDISTRVLETARAGVYPEEKIQFLPKPYLNQYFTAAPGPVWSVLPRIKNQVVFRRFNLMTLRFPFRHPFDIIFCRNVMIYFDDPTRRALVEQFYRWLRPGGYLFIGHSESIRWDQRELEYCMPSVYRKRGG